jgi:hypothetical protein
MSLRRYEITLPTRYNDGTPIEPEKYLVTRREIAARLGALSFLPQPVHGEWTHNRIWGQAYTLFHFCLRSPVESNQCAGLTPFPRTS